ncbi:CBO0543 family protein [Tenuibacillus multivorans]|uniref:CBO0543 family protein n=1 Tax=Tenuibacillus multivorans TaxID=237069 RepID=UPI00115F906E|nr:CBO0543 family protein [Tenuibacillus multivorans]
MRNIICGLIIPNILGLWFFKKDKKLLIKIVPFVWVMATLVQVWGSYRKYWILKPRIRKGKFLSTMPFSLGLYPILSVLMIYFIKHTKGLNTILIFIFSFFTTVAEICALLMGWLKYGNNWNIIKTFFSYLLPYYSVYKYYFWTDNNEDSTLPYSN